MSFNISDQILDKSNKCTLSIDLSRFSKRERQILLKHTRTGLIRDSYAPSSSIAEAIRVKFNAPFARLDKQTLALYGPCSFHSPVWKALESHYKKAKIVHEEDDDFWDDLFENMEKVRNKEKGTGSLPRDTICRRWDGVNHMPLFFYKWGSSVLNDFKNAISPFPMPEELHHFLDNVEGGEVDTLSVDVYESKTKLKGE